MRMTLYKLLNKKQKIMENFDFSRVAKTMRLLSWEWHGVGIPSEKDLVCEASRLIDSAIIDSTENTDEPYIICCTGGFEVFCSKQLDILELKFVVTEWSEDG